MLMVRDSYPIPVLSMLLNNLAGCKFLSKIDLKSAFNLLRVTPGQEHLTAFCTPWGLYGYTVMPFGLASTRATFQRFIQHVLREYIDVCCFVYIDDILVFSKTEGDHLRHIQQVLSKLQEYSLQASLKKCEFFKLPVQFLGFIISSEGLRMDPRKLDTILDWPLPETFMKGLQRFLGFCNFYCRLIPHFSQVTLALTESTKDSIFRPNCMSLEGPRKSFEELQAAFTKAPLFSHFFLSADRLVHVDSSGFAIAGVLSQPDALGNLHPVSFYSRKLTDQERSWPIFDLELLAVVTTFEEWQAWLSGTSKPVLVFSDHANLRYFLKAKALSPKQAWWAVFMDTFHFKLVHLSGVSNPADGPSCQMDFLGKTPLIVPNSLSSHFSVNAVTVTPPSRPMHDILFQPISPALRSLLTSTYQLTPAAELEGLGFRDSLYGFHHRVYIPLSLRHQVIEAYHEAPAVGHPGIARTLSLLLRSFD
jgi:hypothetical protein